MADDASISLINVAIGAVPEVIALLKNLFVKANPAEPEPSDDEVIAAYQLALASSIAKDDAWLAAHPA